LQGIAKYADFKMFEEEGPNTTDVDASLQQLKDNDAKLKELNLNNIKVETCVKGVACRVSRRRHMQCMSAANAKVPCWFANGATSSLLDALLCHNSRML